MSRDFEKLAARAAPAIFVVLWSTGFIATKYVLNNAEPLTYLAIRMVVVVAITAVIVAVARPQWPDRLGMAHSVVSGILVHGFLAGPRSRSRIRFPPGSRHWFRACSRS
jgi:drug/metabolite transporter (DMT)-like permease